MIKRVKVADLKVGVFIHDFNCDWHGENLYIERSLVKDPRIKDILESWGIKEVSIDTERGLDVERSKPLDEVRRETDEAISQINKTKQADRTRVPLVKELQPAREIAQDAIEMVQKSIQRVVEGKPPEVGVTYDLANRMKESLNRNRDALLLLTRIRKKDEYTLYHSVSVSSLVLDMCNHCQLSDQQSLDLAVGAMFHDIGKTLVPQKILNKPRKLNKEEYKEIQRHVEYSVNLLRDARGLPLECYDIALHHHEKFNGTGYPSGLLGDQISYGSQLTCICDVFDAITSARCYKEGMDTVSGLRVVYEGSGMLFNKELAHDFIRCNGVYPIGTCVVLEDGRNGVVVSSTGNIMQPVVQVFYDEKRKRRIKPQKIDLSKTGDVIASYSDPKKFGITSDQLLRKMVPN